MNDIKRETQLKVSLSTSIKKLGEALTLVGQEPDDVQLLMRNALYRRICCCYFVFLNYVCALLELDQETLEKLELHEILGLALEKGLIRDEDADEATTLTGIYGQLMVYNEEYSFNENGMLDEIKKVYAFLERFGSREYSPRFSIAPLDQAEL